MRDNHATPSTPLIQDYPPVPSHGDGPLVRPLPAELLDWSGSQGRRGQESPPTPLTLRTTFKVTEQNAAMVLGIVDRPLTAVRPVELPSARVAPTGFEIRRSTSWIYAAAAALVVLAAYGALLAVSDLTAVVGAVGVTAVAVCGLVLAAAARAPRVGGDQS